MRIKEFQKELARKKIDFALFVNLSSLSVDNELLYFAGYKGVGALVIPKKKKPFLLVPEMEYGRRKDKGIRVLKLRKKKKLFEEVLNAVKRNKLSKKVIGLNKNNVALNLHTIIKRNFKKCRFVDVSLIIEKTRQVKTKHEIEMIKKACKLTDMAFSSLARELKKGRIKKEIEIVEFLSEQARKNNAELSFPPVVASGKGASVPHYEARNIKLRKGFMVLDMGIKFGNYNSDMTRTLYIGKPTKKETELYNFLLDIQKNAIRFVKPGMGCMKVYDFVRESMGKKAELFTHGLGHGIGIKVHELPNLTDECKDKILLNSVFTIEPGLYLLNKFGIRIEDTVLMKEKAIRLTKSTKDLLII